MTDTVLLTYADLGVRLGISAESAKRKALRHKWAKHIGNDGLARVRVPAEALPTLVTPMTEPVMTPVVSPVSAPPLVDELRARLEERGHLVDELRRRAEAAEVECKELRDQLRQEVGRAAEERRDLLRQIDEAGRAAASERERLLGELERLRRPWWRRLRG